MIAPRWSDVPTMAVDPVACTRPNRRQAKGSLVYLACTLACMVMYCVVLAPSCTNDLYWPTYNGTGFAVYLVDVINDELLTHQTANVWAVHRPMSRNYASDDVQATFEAGYARKVFYTELNTIRHAVRDLRAATTSAVATLYVQYCWVDLDRRWELAHTRARAKRCLANYVDNAANYLETTLRNTNWTDYVDANHGAWTITIALALQKTREGAQWLNERPLHSLALSVEDEVAYLTARNLTRFDMTYHNNFKLSMSESIEVVNALQQRQVVLVKSSPFDVGPWTTGNMFWNFRNDVGILAYLNQSLVRGDANHFEVDGTEFSSFYPLQDEHNEYVRQVGLFYDNISPFGSVDVLYEPVPRPILDFFATFSLLLNDVVWPSAILTRRVVAWPSVVLAPAPPSFLVGHEMEYYGGNLLCLFNGPTSFPQAQYSFDDTCGSMNPFQIVADPTHVLFALLMAGPTDVRAICASHATDPAACVHTLVEIADFWQMLAQSTPWRAPALPDLPPVAFFQYATNASGHWFLLRQPLLAPDDSNWSFVGWLAIVEWVRGKREVVRLEGDVSTVFMISDVNPTLLLPGSSQTKSDYEGPQTVYYMVMYTTIVSIALGCLMVLYAAWSGHRFRGRNVLAFHRVATFVWIGRCLLVLRGLTGLVVLSSTTATIAQDIGGAKLVATTRPLGETLLVASESTWVCFVVSDVLLVFTGSLAEHCTAIATVLASAITFGIELVHPVQIDMVLDRRCTGIRIDQGLDCTSGVLRTGWWSRLAQLLVVQTVAPLVGIVVAFALKGTRPRQPQAPLSLYGAAESFLRPQAHEYTWELDSVTCIMTGLVPISYRSHHWIFDVKLWVLLPATSSYHGNATSFQCPKFAGRTVQEIDPSLLSTGKILRYVTVVAGVGYVVVTGVGSVSYIAVSSVNFANDFYWATFNMTGHHVVLADWFNQQFMLRPTEMATRLDEPQWTSVWRNYSNPKITTSIPAGVGLAVQLNQLIEVETAIAGLRRSDPCTVVPWISTQYCWVDWKRQWPMANSNARQARCLADVSNGAVYLETVLRNVDWTAWTQCWGTAFDVAIADELKSSAEGQRWLDQIQRNALLAMSDETSAWKRAGLDKYSVQWQSFKKHGLVNTYLVENAFGVQYPLTLSRGNGSLNLAWQTSFKMYWGLANDLWAVTANTSVVGGKSLIATSANFAFANITMLSVLLQNGTLQAPLYEAFEAVGRDIGPLGSIDMRLVACPDAVRHTIATGADVLRRALAAHPVVGPEMFFNTTMDLVEIVPSKFKLLAHPYTYGGSMTCQESTPYPLVALTQLTMRDFNCGPVLGASFYPTLDNLIISVMAAGLSVASESTIDGVCWHDASPHRCQTQYLAEARRFIQTFIATDDTDAIEAMARSAAAQVRQLNVSLMQYIREAESAPLEIGTSMLMDPNDPTFDMWSWLYVIEWAMGSRDVVAFEGDRGAVTVVTDWATTSSQTVQAMEMPTTFAAYARSGVQYVTGVMLGLAALVCISFVASRGRVEGINMYELNRVGGMVWVGRPLLFLRGVTAVCLLSTSTLELESRGYGIVGFSVPTLPWYETILGAGEVTWLVYIVNDLFMVWTDAYTQYYAPVSSMVVWIVVAILTLVSPVVHRVRIDPACHVDQMDLQLVCQTGMVAIGDIRRLYSLIAIIWISNVASYIGIRRYFGSMLRTNAIHSLLLSSAANHLFDKRHWLHQGVYYMDGASALLNGLLSVRWGETCYVMDVKLWRCFSIAMPNDVPFELAYSVPVRD